MSILKQKQQGVAVPLTASVSNLSTRGAAVPAGGSAGQVLMKLSDDDGHVDWQDATVVAPDGSDYVRKQELTPLNLSDYPTIEDINKLNERLDGLETLLTEEKQAIATLSETHKSDMEKYCADYKASLDNENYVKQEELTMFDMEELLSRIAALEAKVAEYESK